jgi:hypothetical protein
LSWKPSVAVLTGTTIVLAGVRRGLPKWAKAPEVLRSIVVDQRIAFRFWAVAL